MVLNPIPIESYDLIVYFFFSSIAVPAVTFIIITAVSTKYTSHRKTMGKILVGLGIIELLPFIITISMRALLTTPLSILALLGLITLTGGVANIKQVKHHWMFFPIMAAIILIIWTFDAFFVFRY